MNATAGAAATAHPFPLKERHTRGKLPSPPTGVARSLGAKKRPDGDGPALLPDLTRWDAKELYYVTDTVKSFEDLSLVKPLMDALRAQRFTAPTPIQARAIPPAMQGRDVLGIAQTGTGKTAAFLLPILQKLDAMEGKPAPRTARALILSPTRELAAQIHDGVKALGGRMRVSSACVFGGVGKGPQAKQVIRGVDILVATPGRLRDLMEDRAVGLQDVSFLVLDEADRMLDMGFAPEVRRLAKAMPSDRQTVLFSATMPADIAKLANELMRDPVRIEVAPQATTVERIDQKVLFVDRAKKAQLLRDLLTGDTIERAIVFTRTKRGADKVCKHLKAGGFGAVAIHGDKTQGARKQALADFTRGRAPILVATDLAARGIDVDGISHVINYDMPVDAEGYVHRIGRTARAGASGVALSFCAADEVDLLKAVQKVTRQTIPVDIDHAFHSEDAAEAGARGVAVPRPKQGGRPAPHAKPSRPRGAKPGNGPKRRGNAKRGPAKSSGGKSWMERLAD
jgi:ATP-dependent RNA helicase RhlE